MPEGILSSNGSVPYLARTISSTAQLIAFGGIIYLSLANVYLLPLLILLTPVITLMTYVIVSGSFLNWRRKMAETKYCSFFPVFFYYEPESACCSPDTIQELAKVIQPGDVLLRRQDNYLVGLIFAQNSYFTHAGIVCDHETGGQFHVMHATAEEGVNHDTLEQFCQCDAVAVLRFKRDPSLVQQHLNTSRSVKSYVNLLTENERAVYLDYISAGSSSAERLVQARDPYIDFIVNKAHLSEKQPYDPVFDFRDPSKFCCIEFVWSCYNCLSPLHQIKTKIFYYFRWVPALVIVPDMFIASDWFELKYSSFTHIRNDKTLLLKHVGSNLASLKLFLIRVLIGECIVFFLLLLYAIAT